jgi:hypothetical protein
VIFQEGTYAPGITDGIHRWMGSAAMDGQGNMALSYSASNGSNPAVFPSVNYTGRLAGDPLGTMPQGEGSIIAGTGSQTSTGSRWGDYTSLTVDPTDDTTFWAVNEWVPTTSSVGWVLRIGSFKLGGAVTPDFSLSISPASITVPRNGGSAVYTVTITPSGGFNSPVTFSVSGLPAGTTGAFSPNPATTSSVLTLTVNSSTAKGTYLFTVTGMGGSPTITHTATATLKKRR